VRLEPSTPLAQNLTSAALHDSILMNQRESTSFSERSLMLREHGGQPNTLGLHCLPIATKGVSACVSYVTSKVVGAPERIHRLAAAGHGQRHLAINVVIALVELKSRNGNFWALRRDRFAPHIGHRAGGGLSESKPRSSLA